jgi:hypothetical protein
MTTTDAVALLRATLGVFADKLEAEHHPWTPLAHRVLAMVDGGIGELPEDARAWAVG